MQDERYQPDPQQSFLEFVDIPDQDPEDCWAWKGRQVLGNEGLVAAIGLHPGAPIVTAYKRAYELFNGPVQDGMTIHHRCNNPNCVNPDHLYLVRAPEPESQNRKGGVLQRSLLARPSMAKIRNRIAAGVQAKPMPERKRFRTITTIRAGRHQYLRFED